VNIATVLDQVGLAYRDRTAFVWADRSRTYGESADRVNSLARAFTAEGIARGDRIALYLRNCPEVIEAMFAAWKIGACVVPLNPAYTADELAYHLSDSEASLVITDAAGLPTTVRAYGNDGLLVVEDSLDVALADHPSDPLPTLDLPDTTLAWLAYTSGTTGRPKGAMISHRALTYQALTTLADVQRLETEHVTMHAAPLSHGSGYNALAYTMKACTQVMHSPTGFDAGLFLEQVERYRVAAAFLVPTQINMLAVHPDVAARDLTSLQWIMYGGAPMYREHQKRAVRAFGPVFVQIFGQTESPMSGTVLRREEHDFDDDDPRTGSVGRPRLGVDIRIVDAEDNPVPQGSTGEICIKGPTLMEGYWRRPEATAETLRNGWLHTGDVGALDEVGYLHILDRLKDMIISGGLNVYPHEIEDLLTAHPAIAAACVVGIPHEKWGEAVHAVVVVAPDAELDEAAVVHYAKQNLAGYKCPKSVAFVAELPRTSYGKIAKREVRAPYWAHLEHRV
jgi:long-chain acyl-CoA synthetase